MLVLTPALTCVSPRVMIAFYCLCALTGTIIYVFQNKRLPPVDRRVYAAIAVFTAYGAASQIWSINPGSFGKALILGGVFLLGAFLYGALNSFDQRARQIFGRFLFAGFALGAFVYLFEMTHGFPLYDLVRGGHSHDVPDVKQNKAAFLLSIWLFLTFPFAVPGQHALSKALYALAVPVLYYAVFSSESASAQLILAGAPVLIATLWALPRRATLALAFAATVFITAAMPLIAMGVYRYTDWLHAGAINDSVKSRIEIWDQAARRTMEHPLLGWGLDTFRVMPNRGEMSLLSDTPVHHLHPHNAPLQVWVETGAVGVVGACLLFLAFYQGLGRVTDRLAAGYGTFLWTSGFLYTLSIWGLWQSWFTATLCFVTAIGVWSVRNLSTRHG